MGLRYGTGRGGAGRGGAGQGRRASTDAEFGLGVARRLASLNCRARVRVRCSGLVGSLD
jgi:hypothetical protein